MSTLILTGPPGLAAVDFSFELYLDGAVQDSSGIGVTERTIDALASSYIVTGRPTPAAGEFWTLTYDNGVTTGAERFPLSASQPPNFVLPLRQSGVVLADISASLDLDGAAVSLGSITLTSLGSPFDYLLDNLPTAPSDTSTYTLSYSFGALYDVLRWPLEVAGINAALPAVVTGQTIVDKAFAKHLPTLFSTVGVSATLKRKSGTPRTSSGIIITPPARFVEEREGVLVRTDRFSCLVRGADSALMWDPAPGDYLEEGGRTYRLVDGGGPVRSGALIAAHKLVLERAA